MFYFRQYIYIIYLDDFPDNLIANAIVGPEYVVAGDGLSDENIDEIKKLESSPKIIKNLFDKKELDEFFNLCGLFKICSSRSQLGQPFCYHMSNLEHFFCT